MLIVYRKSDGLVASNSGTNSYLPDGPPFEAEVQNAIRKFGGTPEDFGEFRLNDESDTELVQEILAAGSYELIFKRGQPIGIKTYSRIRLRCDKQVVAADGIDKAIIVADVGDAHNADPIEFFVDGVPIGTVQGVEGKASFEFSAANPGVYEIRAESKTPGPPGFQYKHGSAAIFVEAM